jgi:hypothetical protein
MGSSDNRARRMVSRKAASVERRASQCVLDGASESIITVAHSFDDSQSNR